MELSSPVIRAIGAHCDIGVRRYGFCGDLLPMSFFT
jgi:hypothetical protein